MRSKSKHSTPLLIKGNRGNTHRTQRSKMQETYIRIGLRLITGVSGKHSRKQNKCLISRS